MKFNLIKCSIFLLIVSFVFGNPTTGAEETGYEKMIGVYEEKGWDVVEEKNEEILSAVLEILEGDVDDVIIAAAKDEKIIKLWRVFGVRDVGSDVVEFKVLCQENGGRESGGRTDVGELVVCNF